MKAFPGMDLNMDKVMDGHEFEYVPHLGMDLRDYFAAKAMQAIISKQPHLDKPIIFMAQDRMKQVSAGSYLYADAMLKAREE